MKEKVEEKKKMRKACETWKIEKRIAGVRGAFLAVRSAARGSGEE